MRDLILLAALVGIAPLIFRAPIVGLLAWIWISVMNPQREVFGFLQGFGLNFYVAALTIAAWLASKERKLVPPNLLVYALILFAIWSSITTVTALDRHYSFALWDRTIKSIVLALAVATLANTKARIQAVMWMLMVSIGYYAIKGGGFVLLTGGRQHVYGPEASMIEDNNTLGLAMIILLPLINYLRKTSRLAATRLACLGTIGLTLLAVFGTYSRGALLTLAAAAATYAMKSRYGVLLVLLGGVILAAAPSFLPDSWMHRMSTIQTYNADASFAGRVTAWKASYAIAKARPLVGGGYSAMNVDWVARKFSHGDLKIGKAAHSIYFEVLGDHGFVGLALYLAILAAAWLNTFLVLNIARTRADLAWAHELARMLQISLIAFLVGGAALSMAYYDGVLVVFALTAALLQVARRPAGEMATDVATPRWKALAVTAEAPASSRAA